MSDFKARPIYLSTEDHIKAHFFVCYLSLVIIRLLERATGNEYSPAKLVKSLNSYSASHVEQNYYLFDFKDEVIKKLETVIGLDLGQKYLKMSEIRKILSAPK